MFAVIGLETDLFIICAATTGKLQTRGKRKRQEETNFPKSKARQSWQLG